MRLAALYATGVTLLIVALELSVAGIRDVLRDLTVLAMPAGICFGTAFLLLALARKMGFTVLWLVLLGLWSWLTFRDQAHGPRPSPYFVIWTLFAAPLFVMSRVGFQSSGTRSGGARAGVPVTVAIWGTLAIAGIVAEDWPRTLPDPNAPLVVLVRDSLMIAWRIVPIGITIMAVRHVHRAKPQAPQPA